MSFCCGYEYHCSSSDLNPNVASYSIRASYMQLLDISLFSTCIHRRTFFEVIYPEYPASTNDPASKNESKGISTNLVVPENILGTLLYDFQCQYSPRSGPSQHGRLQLNYIIVYIPDQNNPFQSNNVRTSATAVDIDTRTVEAC